MHAQEGMTPRYGVLVPTLNAGPTWSDWIDALKRQSPPPAEVLVIDSGSRDDTAEIARSAGFTVMGIDRRDFNHGGTRRKGVEHLSGRVDFLVCLTQDAMLTEPGATAALLAAFDDSSVGAAFGRQLPASDATPVAEHARAFNYPARSRTVGPEDRNVLGFKACFLSNSFAAYRMSDLAAVGGFPDNVILGEDTTVAARMLLAGRSIRYECRACVYHSHNYGFADEFKRYFDTGVFHARSPWLLEAFGGASGEGKRFVMSELHFLAAKSPGSIPAAMLRTVLKLLGYRLGRAEHWLPWGLKHRMSMFKAYWSHASQCSAGNPKL